MLYLLRTALIATFNDLMGRGDVAEAASTLSCAVADKQQQTQFAARVILVRRKEEKNHHDCEQVPERL